MKGGGWHKLVAGRTHERSWLFQSFALNTKQHNCLHHAEGQNVRVFPPPFHLKIPPFKLQNSPHFAALPQNPDLLAGCSDETQ